MEKELTEIPNPYPYLSHFEPLVFKGMVLLIQLHIFYVTE